MYFVRTFAAGMAVAAVALLATAAPASAHDALISSTPAVDERLDVAPESVSLTFSGRLMTLGDSMSGAVVIVVDESGRDWVEGEVVVDGDTVTAEVASGMPEAGYQVRWQVVSQDGHTIAGVIPFTIGDADPMARAGGSASEADAEVGDQTEQESEGSLRVLLIGAGGALIGALVFALYRFLRRRRPTAAAASASPENDAAK